MVYVCSTRTFQYWWRFTTEGSDAHAADSRINCSQVAGSASQHQHGKQIAAIDSR